MKVGRSHEKGNGMTIGKAARARFDLVIVGHHAASRPVELLTKLELNLAGPGTATLPFDLEEVPFRFPWSRISLRSSLQPDLATLLHHLQL